MRYAFSQSVIQIASVRFSRTRALPFRIGHQTSEPILGWSEMGVAGIVIRRPASLLTHRYKSERSVGHPNQALTHFLNNKTWPIYIPHTPGAVHDLSLLCTNPSDCPTPARFCWFVVVMFGWQSVQGRLLHFHHALKSSIEQPIEIWAR